MIEDIQASSLTKNKLTAQPAKGSILVLTVFIFILIQIFIFDTFLTLGAELPVEEFTEKVRACSDEGLKFENVNPSYKIKLPEKCRFLDSVQRIGATSGATATLDTRYITDAFRRAAEAKSGRERKTAFDKFEKLADYLVKEIDNLAAPVISNGFQPFKRNLDTVLAGSEFSEKPNYLEKLIPEKWKEWFRNLFSRFSKIEPSIPVAAGVLTVFKVLFITAVIFALVFLILKIAPDFCSMGDARLAGEKPLKASNLPATGEIIAAAEDFASAGNFREALRFLYISFIRSLEGHGYVTFLSTKTNREYLDELAVSRAITPELRLLNSMYENHWYGIKECTDGEYRRFCDLYSVCMKELS